MLMAVVLSFLCVTAWTALTGQGCVPRKPKEDPKKQNGEETPGDPNGEQPNGGDPSTQGKPPVPAGNGNGQPAKPDEPAKPPVDPDENHPQKDAPALQLTKSSPELDVVFTSRGGGIEWIALKNHKENGEGQKLDLVVPADIDHLLGQTDTTGLKPDVAPGGAGRKDPPAGAMRRLNWSRNETVEGQTAEDDVVFEFKTRDGVTWRKRWWLVEEQDRYDIRLEMSARGGTADKIQVRLLAAAGQMAEPRKGMDMFGPKQAVLLLTGDDEAEDSQVMAYGHPLVELESQGVSTRRVRLLGSRSLYFTTTLYSDGGEDKPTPLWVWISGEEGAKRPVMEQQLKDWYASRDRKIRDEDGSVNELGARIARSVANMQYAWATYELSTAVDAKPIELAWYTGPIDRSTLAQDGYEPLERMITYPFAPDIVAQALLGIYDIFRNLFGSIGLAVILMTLCVRGLMMPLSIRNQLSMRGYSRKIQKIKPKLTALQEKYKKNPRKLREEQMKLYRENNIGFPGGCLMMIVQIPIWFALFSSLRREFTIRGAEFLWIADLSGPDALIDFGGCFTLLVLQICGLNLLPILMVTLSIIHTRSMPKPQDEQTAQQYKMMKWMPIIFAVILYNYTAALMLYMTLSSGFGILESKIVRAKDEAAKAAVA